MDAPKCFVHLYEKEPKTVGFSNVMLLQHPPKDVRFPLLSRVVLRGFSAGSSEKGKTATVVAFQPDRINAEEVNYTIQLSNGRELVALADHLLLAEHPSHRFLYPDIPVEFYQFDDTPWHRLKGRLLGFVPDLFVPKRVLCVVQLSNGEEQKVHAEHLMMLTTFPLQRVPYGARVELVGLQMFPEKNGTRGTLCGTICEHEEEQKIAVVVELSTGERFIIPPSNLLNLDVAPIALWVARKRVVADEICECVNAKCIVPCVTKVERKQTSIQKKVADFLDEYERSHDGELDDEAQPNSTRNSENGRARFRALERSLFLNH